MRREHLHQITAIRAGQSAISWLDLRHGDLAQAQAFIKAMEGEGVLDELGYLALQGKFADILYPATSTLMRSARYFYFVAAIYRHLERQGVSSARVFAESRRLMDHLRQRLAPNESSGVIGRDRGVDIKQPPSTIYWSGLRQLRFFKAGLSEAGYHARFDEIREQRRGYSDDDKTQQGGGVTDYWDRELPTSRLVDASGNFDTKTNFSLSKAEARDLSVRFRHQFPNSLLVHLLDIERPDVPVPWASPKLVGMLAHYVRHSEALSIFARGTTLQYYALVLAAREAAKLAVPDVNLLQPFRDWWDVARSTLLAWDTEEFGRLPDVGNAIRPGVHGDLAFIRDWLNRLRAASSPAQLLGDEAARRLVRRREIDIKKAKARLTHRKQLEQWRMSDVGDRTYQLNYRHPVGTRFIREILAEQRSGE